MATDPLLTPFRLKSLTLRNRIVSTSHEPAYSDDGLPKDRYRAYHVEKARGGVGLTMIGGSALVSRDSAPAFGNLQVWKDESVPWMRRLADEVHEHGAAVMIQLTHLGHRTSNYTHDWVPAVSASATREPAHRAFAKAAEQWDLDRIKDDFVRGAQACREAGLDGIELMLYGHFLDSFWTPFWNHRDDEYGGSYENRMRYPLEVIRAVRAAVPDDFLVGARVSFDEERAPGVGPQEALRIGRDIAAAGIDFISLVKGSIESDTALSRMIPPMGTPASPHLEFAGRMKRELTVPVMHAARIADVATARYAIEAGLLDLVGMTRALLADPYLPLKVATGQEDRIRPCVGANMCIDSIYTSGAAFCIHNPSSGRELEVPQVVAPAAAPRRVAVVGGGPAGLEAARVAGERGHDVTLFEANSALGGQLALASLSPRRRDLQGIVDWRAQELERLGVKVHLDTYAEADTLAAGGYDVVVVATGGLPGRPDVPGAQLVLDGWDVVSGAKRPTGRVLVYDDHGGTQALDVTEALLRAGAEVELVTPERTVSPEVGALVGAGYFVALAEGGVRQTVLRRLLSVERAPDGLLVTLGAEGASRTETRLVDAVVAEVGTVAVTDLYDELVPGSSNHGEVRVEDLLALRAQSAVRNPGGTYQLFRIGDAVAGRNVHAAMLDAARLARAL
ncbi:FAD-dependent oxidoreductase [Kineosporia sp. R_H_3]|uniref:oxidoreductase n=1 Tax=Kineosporia sp. R_H_3 TaxID=1961848 RepID=UPI000B4A7195|nr:FAD-dependent oxidoreductase [Kineosporia sp. R_H_3]